MSIIGSNILAGVSGQATGYKLNNSLRFRASNSAYLSKTFTTPTGTTKGTSSVWVKRSTLGVDQMIWCASNYEWLQFQADGSLRIANPGNVGYWTTTQVFRDPGAWYHIVVVWDTTLATAADRAKIYVNGSLITSYASTVTITQNATWLRWNVSGYTGTIGTFDYSRGTYNLDGYLAEHYWIDGQALTPSSFGETSTTTGQWIPKKYTGTYGNNGFYLQFADASAATAAAIGKDSSGNGNNWTPSGISVTAGTTYDAMIDVPTLTSATVANYCTWNPILPPSSGSEATSVLDGNLQLKGYNASYNTWAVGSIEVSSGKWYYEFTNNNAADWQRIGIISTSGKLNPTDASAYYMYYSANGYKISHVTSVAYGNTWTTNDIIGVALDLDNGKIFFSKNGTWQASGDPAAGTNAAYTGLTGAFAPASLIGSAVANSTFVNFGQRPFTYTPPTGFVRLNTYNLPDSTIKKGNTVMDATLYTGTGSAQSITNAAGFKPDLIWGKARSTTRFNVLVDSVRGSSKDLYSNSTAAEVTDANVISSINSNGFSLGTDAELNLSANTFVAWQWQAGQGTTSSNTSGSITSTVSVNTTAGFSIVTYTGTGANATVGHGLGVAPAMMIVKNRSSGSDNWTIYHKSTSSTPQNDYTFFTTAATASASTVWQNTAPTSSVFSIGTSGTVNTNANNFVAYCWAEIAGFSKFGSYTGNGSTDGTFVYTGFRPSYILLKRTDAANVWLIGDSKRDGYNSANPSANKQLQAQASNAESNFDIDYLSNGFKLRNTDSYLNASGGTYIYMAYAENPFKNSNAR